ncbi:unnamed protein product [Chrysoparadoxa australica]
MGKDVSSFRQFRSLAKKNFLLKKRHPWSLLCELLLPVLFMVLLGALKSDKDIVDAVIQDTSYPVPDLSYIASQTSFPNALCHDDNILHKCTCNYEKPLATATISESISGYYFPGLNYPILSMWEAAHSRNAYVSVCSSLAFLAQLQTPLDCTVAQLAYDVCPSLVQFLPSAEDATAVCPGIVVDNVMTDPAVGQAQIIQAIQLAEAAGGGASVPAELISGDDGICAPRLIAVAPVPADGAAPSTAAETAAVDLLAYITAQAPTVAPWLRSFPSEDDVTDYVKQPDYARVAEVPSLGSAVIINEASSAAAWDYTIKTNLTHSWNEDDNRYGSTNVPFTDQLVANKRHSNDTGAFQGLRILPSAQSYYVSGVLSLQQLVDNFIISQEGSAGSVQYRVANFPSNEYETDGFWDSVGFMFSFLIVLATMYPVANVIKALVVDKEKKIKEGMLMMGLGTKTYTMSWVFHFLAVFFFLSLLLTITGARNVFEFSSPGIVFFFFFLFSWATIAYCFFLSTFFSRARTATTFGSVIFFMSLFPYFAVDTDGTSASARLAACVFPPTCLAVGTLPFIDYEDSGIGVTAETFAISETVNISMAQVYGMFLFDTVLFAFLAWYAGNVVPTEWGTNRPWYFLFTRSYWFPGSPKVGQETAEADLLEHDETLRGNNNIEPVGEQLRRQLQSKRCVALRNLSKVYNSADGQTFKAVDELSLTFYGNQITALLGHNGAGKTTTISMLTGMIPITSGSALVNGKDAKTQMTEIRQDLGVCPQHDILYEDMTVLEHLRMFAAFKGVPSKEVEAEVEKMIVAVGLTEKRKAASKNLSGGQKRKLSVAIAFIGSPKMVFLDEPTSGMDPHSRRWTWKVIQSMRSEGRIIVLTTHFMDEADLLGDRIAIMAHGELRCCGSSLFLKRHYGVGYNLTVVKAIEEAGRTAEEEGKEGAEVVRGEEALYLDGQKSSAPIKKLVHSFVEEATTLSEVGAEVSFQLPSAASSVFKNMLLQLDERSEELGISSYGMSITTLEEVFLRVARGTVEVEDRKRLSSLRQSSFSSQDAPEAEAFKEIEKAVEYKPVKTPMTERFARHVRTLLWKRAAIFKRDKLQVSFSLLAPAIFLLIGMLLLLISAEVDQPQLVMSESMKGYNVGRTPQNLALYSTTCRDATATCDITDVMSSIPDTAQPEPSVAAGPSVLELNQALLSAAPTYESALYGAYSFESVDATGDLDVTAHANFTGLHAAPQFLNAAATGLLRQITGAEDAEITLRLQPFPFTSFQQDVVDDSGTFATALFLMIGYAFIPAAWVGFVVKERETKSKHQQVVSGVSLHAYWVSTLVWDMAVFVATPVITIILLYSFQASSLYEDGGALPLILLVFLYGPANAAFTYALSFLFSTYASAMTTILFINWVFGLFGPLAVFFMLFFDNSRTAGKVLKWAFRVFPPFCLGDGILNLGNRSLLAFVYGFEDKPGAWDISAAGANIIFLIAMAAFYWILTLLLERFFAGTNTVFTTFTNRRIKRRLRNVPDGDALWDGDMMDASGNVIEDEDVVLERQRVQAAATSAGTKDVIAIEGLRKAYPAPEGKLKIAVRNTWLGVPKGEVFGLLGINGAGKTTIISTLCGEQEPTQGRAELSGIDVSKDVEDAHHLIGYCPQFDSLFERMTPREHLLMYARIKGIQESVVGQAADAKLKEMDLIQYADKLAGGLSGGNKRKLSVAVALIGGPEIVFLDEPSTGVDPVARRFMWGVISEIVQVNKECALVLTTHSMEEAEALCQRIGIMVGGRLRYIILSNLMMQAEGNGREPSAQFSFSTPLSHSLILSCLGSAQHLKSRFGQGYQLELVVDDPSPADVGAATLALNRTAGLNPDNAELTTEQATRAMEAFPAQKPQLTVEGNGFHLAQELAISGKVATADLAEWCALDNACTVVESFAVDKFSGATLSERQGSKMRFALREQEGLALGGLFGIIEDNKAKLHIREYALGQTSLEQIFNQFASQQLEETGSMPGYEASTSANAAAPAIASRQPSQELRGDGQI